MPLSSLKFFLSLVIKGSRCLGTVYKTNVFAVLMWYIYILKCSDNTYYTGCSSDLDDRLYRHSKGENTYTRVRLPVILVYFSAFQDKNKAYEFEKYLKSDSGKAFARKRLL